MISSKQKTIIGICAGLAAVGIAVVLIWYFVIRPNSKDTKDTTPDAKDTKDTKDMKDTKNTTPDAKDTTPFGYTMHKGWTCNQTTPWANSICPGPTCLDNISQVCSINSTSFCPGFQINADGTAVKLENDSCTEDPSNPDSIVYLRN